MLELKYLHHASVLQCTHGGKAEFIPPPRRSFHIEDSPILTEMDLLKATIVGCTQAGPGIKPCTKITKILMGKAREIRVDGEVPLLENLRAATDGTPPGVCSKVINNLSNAKTGSVQLDGAQAQTLITARESGLPFCEICEEKSSEHSHIFDEKIRIIDEISGEPVSDYPYYIEKEGRKILFGYTDERGTIPRLSPNDKEEQIVIYWGDEALYKNGYHNGN